MTEKMGTPEPHPDDFILITVSLEFQAKLNPKVSDPFPFETTTGIENTLSAAGAADYLEKVVSAIRERLYRRTAHKLKQASPMKFQRLQWSVSLFRRSRPASEARRISRSFGDSLASFANDHLAIRIT